MIFVGRRGPKPKTQNLNCNFSEIGRFQPGFRDLVVKVLQGLK